MKEKYNFVIIVLTYRNMKDLQEFIESVEKKVNNYKIIIVNAFCDKKSDNEARTIARNNKCDFIQIENKGYSYGNNIGIQYALENYDFKYIIVSNPDIIIKNFINDIKKLEGDIVAPQINAADGRNQNPMIIKESKLAEKCIYVGFKKNVKFLLILGIGINKINREIFMRINTFFNNDKYKIFAAHGSFVMISKKAINVLDNKPYDENIFLFSEENVLANKAKNRRLITMFDSNIKCYHKEDGSMKLSNISINKELSKSNIYYYENYILKRRKKI